MEDFLNAPKKDKSKKQVVCILDGNIVDDNKCYGTKPEYNNNVIRNNLM